MHIGQRRHHKTIDTPEQVLLRDAIIETELIEKACLIAAPPFGDVLKLFSTASTLADIRPLLRQRQQDFKDRTTRLGRSSR